ncbi:MFS transporter [Microbacterium sp. SA39]|uniref:MFS transporter n=1 Tax=Microbacterium sp. SA39 TaxID=1263625 RepID=UPI0005F9D1A0|nr:MFS transporter [Microbacterium sp. SA39]KJQ53038.1 Major Facilitator Superfamily protein [Microbacterium sp. SA39]
MTHASPQSPTQPADTSSLFRLVGLPYFLLAFIARLPFAMMVVGVLTVVVSARGSLSLGGLTSAAVGLGTACFGPLLGAAADRFGQRGVLLALAVANGTMLVIFTVTVYGAGADGFVLLAAVGIGATAPQVAPLSRSRLVTIIRERMPEAQRTRTLSGTMAYESAADETVFVFGPFLVGILASALAPWAPLVGAAALTVVFVGAFALHPSGRHVSLERDADGKAPSAISDLFRPQLLIVVLGILGVGIFFGAMLTALTSFMADRGAPEQAGLLYGVMGVGSAILALGVAWLPPVFTLRTRWLVFSGILLAGTALLPFADSPATMTIALAIMGVGIGPTLVTQYSFGAARSPIGRSATVMTMLGSGVVVGQSLGAATTGGIAESIGTAPALFIPVIAALVVFVAGVVNWFLSRTAPRAARTVA